MNIQPSFTAKGVLYNLILYTLAAFLHPSIIGASHQPDTHLNTFPLGKNTSANVNELIILAQQKQISGKTTEVPSKPELFSNQPAITGNDATTERMFGQRGGFIHPYFKLQGEWTDNLYNLDVAQVDTFLATASAGVWYSLPRLDEVPVSFLTHNSAIGGARLLSTRDDSFERSIAYLSGNINYTTYTENSDLNYASGNIEGLYQQNLPVGITLGVLDRFTRGQDAFDRGSFLPEDFNEEGDSLVKTTPSVIRQYYSNLANLSIYVDVSSKLTGELQYSNFFLNYDDDDNSWLNRTDNRYGASLKYKYSPKTSFVLEYDHVVIDYETEDIYNGDSSFYVFGMTWKGSEKTSLSAKGGYQTKQYSSGDASDLGTFTSQIVFNYAITDKTKIAFYLYKALEESNSQVNSGMDTIATNLHYEQRFNYRVLARVDFNYEKNEYEAFTSDAINDSIEQRSDTRFLVRPAIEYTLRDWLMFDLSYIFENRNSNLNNFDYTTQRVTFSVNMAF